MTSTRLIFFGTPEFAVPTLAALQASGRSPRLVVSQPDRPVGRGRRRTPPPVAQWAAERGLPLRQPESVRDRGFLEELRRLEPDLAVVVAFGQIFRKGLLELPRWGCLNLHASLLPAYRGAAPIQAALADGLAETGVSTMRMERGLDAGPVYLQRTLVIGAREKAPELSERLAAEGARLVLETVHGLEAGTLRARAQDDDRATYAPRVSKQDGEVDFRLPASRLVNRERAYTPWPGLTTRLGEERVKLFDLEVARASGALSAPGRWEGLVEGRLIVTCGDGSAVGIGQLQRAGRKVVSAADFLRGQQDGEAGCFGKEAP